MSLDSDVIVDRRRLRRKLTFWRVAAVLVAIAALSVIGLALSPGGRTMLSTTGSIARVNIEGLIRSDQDRVEALERLENSSAAAVIVHINSPGGTTAGSEQLYDSLVRLKAKKPLVVVVEGLAYELVLLGVLRDQHVPAWSHHRPRLLEHRALVVVVREHVQHPVEDHHVEVAAGRVVHHVADQRLDSQALGRCLLTQLLDAHP